MYSVIIFIFNIKKLEIIEFLYYLMFGDKSMKINHSKPHKIFIELIFKNLMFLKIFYRIF